MAFFESIPGLKQSVGIIPYSASRQNVVLGFKPKSLFIFIISGTALGHMMGYDESYSTTKYKAASGGAYSSDVNLGTTSGNRLYSINEDGFSFNKFSDENRTVYYIATGE